MTLQLLTYAEQVARHLRGELTRGRWLHVLPGIKHLGRELGVNHSTMEAALRLLEAEGLLAAQGHGLPRRVVAPLESGKPRSLRVKILLYESIDRGLPDEIELLARLREAGHAADFAPKSMHDLGMRVEKVARFVEKHPADAWVISAGSREILEWFSSQSVPAFANYGRFTGLPIAATTAQKTTALESALHRMVELGHRRIVLLARGERRKPEPGLFERHFLSQMAALGLPTGSYNLPDWNDHPVGLRACLDSLFRHTPPTALIVAEMQIFQAVQQYLARRGILIPERVSVLCTYPDLSFAWCHPAISHIRWDHRQVIQRVLKWAHHVACGKADRRQTQIKAEFVEGGTIGPAPQ